MKRQVVGRAGPAADIANGTAGRHHALAYNQAMTKRDRDLFDAQLNEAPPGTIVPLPHPPS
jgi:hypothetical protein